MTLEGLIMSGKAYLRHSILLPLVVAMGGLATPSWALEDQVVVLTSYPQEVVSRFEEAFEQAHPGTRVEVLWRMPQEALPYLLDPAQQKADVYWSAAPHNFATLRDRGLLQPIAVDRAALPDAIGTLPISDPKGMFLATEVAGFGMTINPGYLKEHGLPEPHEWADLADAVYAGHVNFPIPSQIHFGHSLVEIILQAHGWADGWAMLSAIAGNSRLVDAGAFVSDEVARSQRGIGVSIDFFAASAIANGAPVKFVYPSENGYSPAHIAIAKAAPHPQAAQAFAAFVLSDEGQKLLFHHDIRKLPVRPAVYAQAPAGYFNPFAAAAKSTASYDLGVVEARRGLDEALFDQMAPRRLKAFTATWTAIHQAEARAATDPALAHTLHRARTLAAAIPVTPQQARDPAYLGMFGHGTADPAAKQAVAAEEARWAAFFDRNYAQATKLARGIDAARRH